MNSNWLKYQVSELQAERVLLVEDGNHGEYRPLHDEFTTVGTPFIRAADMEGGSVLFDSAERINDAALARIRKGVGKPGDVILSHKGTVGKVAFAPLGCEPFVCSPQTTFWRTLDEQRLSRAFLFAYLRSPAFHQQLARVKGETDMADYVSLTVQRTLMVYLPPIEEQHAIVDVLQPLDDKIDLNRRMNQTLETLAQTLFRSWFVDFDPVRTMAEGRKPEGMDAETAALFPSRFMEASHGSLPAGWTWLPLDRIAHFLNGIALQKFPPMDGANSLPVIKIAQLRRGSVDDADRASAGIPSEYVVQDGDILFSWSGSLLVSMWAGGQGALNQHLFKVTSTEYPKWFYLLWCKEHLPEFQRIAQAKATTMGHIQRHHLTQALVAVPPSELLKVTTRFFEPLIARWLSNALESRTLLELRDTLLPKLLSGEIRVPEAEAQLAASA